MQESQLAINSVSTNRHPLDVCLAAYARAGFRFVEFSLRPSQRAARARVADVARQPRAPALPHHRHGQRQQRKGVRGNEGPAEHERARRHGDLRR